MTDHTRRSLPTLYAAAALLSLLAGCHGGSGGQDMAQAGPDLAPRPDLFTPPPADLTTLFPPLLGSVSPNIARSTSAAMVTVSGSGFVAGARLALTFGGKAAGAVTWKTVNQLTATLPSSPGALGPVTVALTNGDGQTTSDATLFSFALTSVSYHAPTTVTTPTGPRSVVAYDFNGDKKIDLAVASGDAGQVSFLKGNGDGTFAAAVPTTVGAYPFALSRADIDGDGKMDLVTANQMGNSLSILYGNGDGTFQAATLASVCSGPQAVVPADMNGDKKVDLVVACYGAGNVQVLLNNGDKTFKAVTASYGGKPYSLTVADVNGDNQLDVVTADSDLAQSSVLLNDGAGNLSYTSAQSYKVGAAPFTVLMVDLDRDGYPELITSNAVGNSLTVLIGNPDHTQGLSTTITVPARPEFFISRDVDGDGVPDLIVASLNAGQVTVLLGKGDYTFAAPITLTTGTKSNGLDVADVDGDGLPDLVVTNYGDNQVGILKNTSQ